jgi:hypothetical protein
MLGRSKPRSVAAAPHIPASDVIATSDAAAVNRGGRGVLDSGSDLELNHRSYRTPHSKRMRIQSLLRAVGLMGRVALIPGVSDWFHGSHRLSATGVCDPYALLALSCVWTAIK